jgi:drug/metabolite transporter (DMT)-like permease
VQGGSSLLFTPWVVARCVVLAIALLTLRLRHTPFPSPRALPLGPLAGLFDIGGNVLYLLAKQHVRLDVAAVLSSLYPVATVLLARFISREKVARSQWLGVAVCLAAIALITL